MTNLEKRNSKLKVTLRQWTEIYNKEMAISEDLRKHDEVEQASMMIKDIKKMLEY
jgi:hypothetical protein